MLNTLPNILTAFRIGLIPVMVFAFYTNSTWGKWASLFIFIFASITDFLDGYLARAWSQTSKLGEFLDPVADKLLVASTLFLLAGFDQISHFALMPAIVILCREILVSGLREFLGEMNVHTPVSKFAKWKTAVQMISISLLLLGSVPDIGKFVLNTGEALLWIAAVMTLVTGYDYIKASSRYL
ncbi:MAG: CDP-diacylglycerol--glycerol-3-phosphate 3-phosphatidyltransferase [Alphaproteobacteria bacterium]|nr:CDP-diacylglycerol--glycerol-3-phosphate 3-phosphatidyltransferase [Alphaproteobacteria bacterium]